MRLLLFHQNEIQFCNDIVEKLKNLEVPTQNTDSGVTVYWYIMIFLNKYGALIICMHCIDISRYSFLSTIFIPKYWTMPWKVQKHPKDKQEWTSKTLKTEDWVTSDPTKIWGEIRYSWSVSISCTACCTCREAQVEHVGKGFFGFSTYLMIKETVFV